jgi:prepilin-type N-terminal cleavage/methylation domain-containing protein
MTMYGYRQSDISQRLRGRPGAVRTRRGFDPARTGPLPGSGFTLIELMIVLTIAGILAFLAAPSMKSFIYTERLAGEARDMIEDLNYARSEAIREGKCNFSTATNSYQNCVTVCKQLAGATTPYCDSSTSTPWTSGRVIFVDANLNGQVDAGEAVLRVRETLDGASSGGNKLLGDNTSDGTGVRIVYASDGTVLIPPNMLALNDWFNNSNNALTEKQWLLCDNRGHLDGRAIVLSATGRPRMTDPGKDMSGTISSATCPP